MKKLIVILLLIPASYFAATVNLVWDRQPDPNVAGYNIYRATPPQMFVKLNTALLPQSVDPMVSPTYTDMTPTNNQQYSYVVTAVSTAGIESGNSNIAVFNPPPNPPTNLRIMSFTAVNLTVNGVQVAMGPVPLNYTIPRQTPPRSYLIQITAQ